MSNLGKRIEDLEDRHPASKGQKIFIQHDEHADVYTEFNAPVTAGISYDAPGKTYTRAQVDAFRQEGFEVVVITIVRGWREDDHTA